MNNNNTEVWSGQARYVTVCLLFLFPKPYIGNRLIRKWFGEHLQATS